MHSYYHFFNKGFTINYFPNNISSQIPKEVNINKFKKKIISVENKKKEILESLILGESGVIVGKILLNGEKKLETKFDGQDYEKLILVNDSSGNSQSNMDFPIVRFSFKCIESISELIFEKHKGLSNDLILTDAYFKINLTDSKFLNHDNSRVYSKNKYDLLFKNFTDLKGDIWNLFLVKEEGKSIYNNILKGFKKYSIKQ